MSKEKVDVYREQKKHRKENIAKERARKKRNSLISKLVGCICLVAVVAAVGVSGYNVWKASQPEVKDYSTTTQMVSDMTGVTTMDEETEAETVEEAVETEAETEAE